MQSRRHEILNILKLNGEATVDELATMLELTPVTVRHHLDILRADGLVEAPAVRRRRGPGRPQYVYTLTPDAADQFPKNYDSLATELLDEIKTSMEPGAIHTILGRIAERRLGEAPAIDPNLPMENRLNSLVEYMTRKGFIANWEHKDGKWFIYASNCPYHNAAKQHPELCEVDHFNFEHVSGMQLISLQRIIDGAHNCTYQISPAKETKT